MRLMKTQPLVLINRDPGCSVLGYRDCMITPESEGGGVVFWRVTLPPNDAAEAGRYRDLSDAVLAIDRLADTLGATGYGAGPVPGAVTGYNTGYVQGTEAAPSGTACPEGPNP